MVPSLASIGMALFTLAIYTRTMAPTITWRNAGADSGDFVTAAINLGVPHPTGYPLYTMIAHVATIWPGAEPARCVTFLSAIAGAVAVGIFFWTVYRWVTAPEGVPQVLGFAAAWASSGLVAFGELLWSQATIAEVYSLHALLCSLWLAIALHAPERRRPYLLALVFGLGMANHVTFVLLLPALWPYLPALRRWWSPKRLFALGLCLLPGVLAYLYIPIRAAAQPVPNWGRADDLHRLIRLVTGYIYRAYIRRPRLALLQQRFPPWAGTWTHNLGPVGLILALLGLGRGMERQRRFLLAGITHAIVLSAYVLLYGTVDAYLYLLPALLICALWAARGAVVAARTLQSWGESMRRETLAAAAGLLALIALPLAPLGANFQRMDLHADDEAAAYARSVLEAARENALVISGGDEQTFSLWYLRYGLRERPDVMLADQGLLAFAWYRENLAARHPELSAVVRSSDARHALRLLLQEVGATYPIHLTYSDPYLSRLATWEHEPPLYTLVRD